jgi:hypothetical protein
MRIARASNGYDNDLHRGAKYVSPLKKCDSSPICSMKRLPQRRLAVTGALPNLNIGFSSGAAAARDRRNLRSFSPEFNADS